MLPRCVPCRDMPRIAMLPVLSPRDAVPRRDALMFSLLPPLAPAAAPETASASDARTERRGLVPLLGRAAGLSVDRWGVRAVVDACEENDGRGGTPSSSTVAGCCPTASSS